jgi:hypothetical protein
MNWQIQIRSSVYSGIRPRRTPLRGIVVLIVCCETVDSHKSNTTKIHGYGRLDTAGGADAVGPADLCFDLLGLEGRRTRQHSDGAKYAAHAGKGGREKRETGRKGARPAGRATSPPRLTHLGAGSGQRGNFQPMGRRKPQRAAEKQKPRSRHEMNKKNPKLPTRDISRRG